MYKAPQTQQLQESLGELKKIKKEKEQALEERRYDDAAELRTREEELEDTVESLRSNWDSGKETAVVLPEDIAEMVAMWTGIPVTRIAQEESERLLNMEEDIHKRIVGQQEAIDAIAKAVRRARAGLKDPRRPVGSFIFLGPTGVGKTELTKALAELMFGSEDALVQIDMSEFMERHSTARLVGAPPGYVGYEDAGQLTEAIRRRPYSIVVFDEIEKAHPDTFGILLQIMEEGILTDARGRKVDFRNTIIIMTSNVGAQMIRHQTSLGFDVKVDEEQEEQVAYKEMRRKLMEALKRTFRPEFINRLDSVIVFRSLTKDEIKQIVSLELKKVGERLSERSVVLEATDAATAFLADKGYDHDYGARPLKRVIQNEIEDRLSDGFLAGKFKDGDTILISLVEGNLDVQVVKKQPEALPEESIVAM